MNKAAALRSTMLACAASLAGIGSAAATPTYQLVTTIAVPAASTNTAKTFTTYDIGAFDGTTQTYYLADRSNASVDVFSAATNQFVTRIPGFQGIQATTSVSGPDGVAVATGPGLHTLYAGDGNSTLAAFTIGANNTYTPLANSPIATGPASANRVDEMSFSPVTKTLLAANNAAAVPFTTLVDTTTNKVIAQTVFDGTNGTPNAAGGIEASDYDAKTGTFFLAIPTIGTSGPGGVSEIDAQTGAVIRTIDFASFGITACSPTGVAASAGGNLVIGCGDASQTLVLDPTKTGAGILVSAVTQASGADEVWYDPTSNLYFLADRSDPTGPQLGIIDAATSTFLQNVPTTAGDHSVAVDPVSGEVFVPLGASASNTVCALGCIGVYAQVAVPEPASLGLLGAALATVAGLARLRRHRQPQA